MAIPAEHGGCLLKVYVNTDPLRKASIFESMISQDCGLGFRV